MAYQIIDLNFLGEQDTIASFLIPTTAGVVLIESGPHSTYDALTERIEALGYNVEAIKHVFLSHIHFDHAGAAWCFAEKGATIYVHPAGAKHLASPEKLYNSAKMIYGDDMERLWGLMQPIAETQLYVPSHGEVITIGDTTLQAWHTPGHAVHHIAWQMGDTLFTGDVAGVKIDSGKVVPPCPPPDINIEDWQQSIALMKSLPIESLVLTHFGRITDVAQHLIDLEAELLAWANWIKPHHEQQTPQAEIIPLFQAFVAERLTAAGIADKDLPKYEKANPAFMSVAGLMRYWYKKGL